MIGQINSTQSLSIAFIIGSTKLIVQKKKTKNIQDWLRALETFKASP